VSRPSVKMCFLSILFYKKLKARAMLCLVCEISWSVTNISLQVRKPADPAHGTKPRANCIDYHINIYNSTPKKFTFSLSPKQSTVHKVPLPFLEVYLLHRPKLLDDWLLSQHSFEYNDIDCPG